MAQDALIEAKNVSKHFMASKHGVIETLMKKQVQWVKAVDRVSLDVGSHEILSLVGESGAGKTTMGRLFSTLENPTGGEILFMGAKLDKKNLVKIRRQIQMVFQNPLESLDPRMSLRDIVVEPLAGFKLSGREKTSMFENTLPYVGLDPAEFASRRPKDLSGGQRQRVAIARAIISNPNFVVLDEPTSALDASIQAQVLNLLADLYEKNNYTYLIITHNIAVAKFISDRIAVMYAGRIVELGPTEETIENPQHPYTQALLKSVPSLGSKEIEGPEGETPSLLNPPSGCRFHPRCPYAMEICKTTEPELIQVGSDQVACWLFGNGKK
jgi:peptide/nickel transport system ATP-binding protein